jgi:hypothetical protein
VEGQRFGGIKPSENEREQGRTEDVIEEAACHITVGGVMDAEGLGRLHLQQLLRELILCDEVRWPAVPVPGREETGCCGHSKG